MISGTIATLITAGSLGGAILGGLELLVKYKKAKKVLGLIRDLSDVIETDFEKLSQEGQLKARKTISRMNGVNIENKF